MQERCKSVSWSLLALGAQCTLNILAVYVPRSPDAKYVHYCDNETIQGVEFKSVPDVGSRVSALNLSCKRCL